MNARRPIRYVKARVRLLRIRHPALPHKIVGASFSGEMSYHVAELAGMHTMVAVSAALILGAMILQLLLNLRG